MLNDTVYDIVPTHVPIKGFEVNLELLFPCLQAASSHRHLAADPSSFACVQRDQTLEVMIHKEHSGVCQETRDGINRRMC